MYEVTSSIEVVRKDESMTKRRKLEIDSIIFLLLYAGLFVTVILVHNLLDIIYFITLTFYLIRLILCRKKKDHVNNN